MKRNESDQCVQWSIHVCLFIYLFVQSVGRLVDQFFVRYADKTQLQSEHENIHALQQIVRCQSD